MRHDTDGPRSFGMGRRGSGPIEQCARRNQHRDTCLRKQGLRSMACPPGSLARSLWMASCRHSPVGSVAGSCAGTGRLEDTAFTSQRRIVLLLDTAKAKALAARTFGTGRTETRAALTLRQITHGSK